MGIYAKNCAETCRNIESVGRSGHCLISEIQSFLVIYPFVTADDAFIALFQNSQSHENPMKPQWTPIKSHEISMKVQWNPIKSHEISMKCYENAMKSHEIP